MAVMHPGNLDNFEATKSENQMYEKLRDQLDNNYHVFYSVTWYTIVNGVRKNSECDFLIFHPNYGYLVIEVKGGIRIELKSDKWILYSRDINGEIIFRELNESPFKQAASSMYYFNAYYKNETLSKYRGIYGMAVAFPFFSINTQLGNDAPKDITIDIHDMDNLSAKINSIFHYWKGRNNSVLQFFSTEQSNKFINLVNKRIALAIAAGALISITDRKLQNINVIQDVVISLIEKYKRVKIVGGAGTGKTWIAIKKIKQQGLLGKKCLYICYSKDLANYVKQHLIQDNIICCSMESLFYTYLNKEEINSLQRDRNGDFEYKTILSNKVVEKFDCIMVDEAQDLTKDWAESIALFSKENGILYIFYDENQNIYGRDFGKGFSIDTEPYLLVNNIRNTRNIHLWIKDKTQIGEQVISNDVFGCDPELYNCNNEQAIITTLNSLLNKLIIDEKVNNDMITILGDCSYSKGIFFDNNSVGRFRIIDRDVERNDETVLYQSVSEFKGLEANVIIYINKWKNSIPKNKEYYDKLYIAGTRAKYYLCVINVG